MAALVHKALYSSLSKLTSELTPKIDVIKQSGLVIKVMLNKNNIEEKLYTPEQLERLESLRNHNELERFQKNMAMPKKEKVFKKWENTLVLKFCCDYYSACTYLQLPCFKVIFEGVFFILFL